ncbi:MULTISPECIES: ABC transporter permease [unclassified Bradyrhizobium]|uniref:ABC transporter permease n=1 Tax=unclassified Bradyrhizobium TaxID=2631580 RepID=UPI001BADAF9C|nr:MULTISPECIES: ABC transporter permease [unclassified Bradyrhizobium]MBR1201497.1 ABC transporter permease [Bradyrhizobium sp. AUGA SZCCT0124]MBR1310653.1 ABC transporter permease [Bradyrhizobium sp. AUGA SZCCT0051]MBR1340796.1 ABC transporter permease [Bradyrhizobium sp. AUGA SZCCT0105]MBR1355402.1 ABC transporter permease [Bradyrhizobium sp. AUGA SZCCT0045]
MRLASKPGFWRVAQRECQWLVRDRVALLLIFGVPLFAFVVLTAVFSQPVIRGLGVTIVDTDKSDTSRALTQQVAASPSLRIVDDSGSLSSAVQDIRSGKAISAIFIPPNFERDLKADRRPQVVGFYNQQFLTAAGIASSGLNDVLSAAASAAAPANRAAPAPASMGTLSAETIALVNPQKNYAQFLLRALLPTIIHVVITLAAGYSVGSEFHRRNAREWLESAGGDPIAALAGKLAPLFVIFILIMLAQPLILEGVLQIPFKGDVLLMIAAGLLLIIAYLSLGALLQLLVGDLATGLGLAGLIASPAFGYAGVGFPTIGMNTFAQVWSAILPLRWYMAVLMGQAARGLPASESAIPFAALAGLTLLFAALALLRMASLTRRGWFAAARPAEPPVSEPASSGVGGAFTAEWRRVLGTRSAFSLLFLAPLVYGIYYPQPYLNQILRKLPIAVVDNDLSDLSRQIVETLDASGTLSVTVRARTLAEASTAIDRGYAFAAVQIPPGTERDVLKGLTAHIPVYADATYLFIFRSTAGAVATAIGTLTSELVSRGARADGSLVKAKLASLSPANVLLQPIFNPVGGYASYIVPAAFMLILQQTLLIGAAMLTGTALANSRSTVANSRNLVAGVFGRGVAHLTIYLPALALYLIVLPRIYGFSTLGHLPQIFALATVFLLATSFMGQAIGAWFTRPENATILLLATSLPQFFTAGFAWPREAIPPAATALGRLFPADSAIDGLVRINQLGASIWEVSHDWLRLWCLALGYFVLAVISALVFKRGQQDAQR